MTLAVLAAVALWRDGRIVVLAAAVLAVRRPVLGLAAVAVWVTVSRLRAAPSSGPDDEAATLERIVAELRGGASPRAALVRVASASPPVELAPAARAAEAGLSAGHVAPRLAECLPRNGRLTAAAWALASEAGAPAGPVMSLLARRAAARGRLDRERRALTAQARATAWLIGGVPLAVCAVLALTGRIGAGPAAPILAAGIALQFAGLAVVALMIRRASL